MAFNVDKLLSKVQNPADKLSSLFEQKAETALLGALNDAFAKIGLGASSRKGLLGNLAGAALASLASEIFGGSKSKARGANTFNEGDDKQGNVDTSDDRTGKMEDLPSAESAPALTFPTTLGEYKMQIDIKEYKRPNPTVAGTFKEVKSIYLPLPRALVDTHEVKYDTMETNVVGTIADRVMGQGPANNSFGRTALEGVIIATSELVGKSRFGDAAIGIAEQTAGGIINPNLGVFFKGPTLREHRFDWLFAPENDVEMQRLQEIIVLLKRASLPNYSKNNNTAFLQYPNMVHVKLLPWAEKDTGTRGSKGYENNYLYIYKHAMINNVSVNYAPDSPVFIKTGNENTKAGPAFVGITMTIIEIEYFTAEDYGGIAGLREQLEISPEAIKKDVENLLQVADPTALFDNPDEVASQPVQGEELTVDGAGVTPRAVITPDTTTTTTEPIENIEIQKVLASSGGMFGGSIIPGTPERAVDEYLIRNELPRTDEERAKYSAELVSTSGMDEVWTINKVTSTTTPGGRQNVGEVLLLRDERGQTKYGYRETRTSPIQLISKDSYDRFVDSNQKDGFTMRTSQGRNITIPANSEITNPGRTDPNNQEGEAARYIGNDGQYELQQNGN